MQFILDKMTNLAEQNNIPFLFHLFLYILLWNIGPQAL